MAWVDQESAEGKAAMAQLWQRDRGEYAFVQGWGHSSLCRCVRRHNGRTIANRLVPCNCWWGSGGRVGQPTAPTVERPHPRDLLKRALAEFRRIAFGIEFACPSCGRCEERGHAPDCEIQSVLLDGELVFPRTEDADGRENQAAEVAP